MGAHARRRLAMLGLVIAAGPLAAQTTPAFGPGTDEAVSATASTGTPDMPLADYLGLLQQIAPAAEAGARTYLAAVQLRCRKALTTAELRQSFAEGDGHPILMGLVRAAHQQDRAARDRWIAQVRCTPGRPR